MPEPRVHRIYQPGKPRFQLRQGEEAISVFDAESVAPADVFPSFRPGNLIITVEIAMIESFGLMVAKTPGDPTLPDILQENHLDIQPREGMTRKQFKAALRALEQAIGALP